MEYLYFLTDPTVIITLVIALFAHYLASLGRYLVLRLFSLSSVLKTWLRVKKISYKRRLLLIATSPSEITWHTVRTYTFFILFVVTFVAYIIVVTTLLNGVEMLPVSVQLLIACPIFVWEVLWLKQKNLARDLIEISDCRALSRASRFRLAQKKKNKKASWRKISYVDLI